MLQNDAFFTHSSLGFFCLVALLRFEVFVWAGVRGLSISWCLDLRFLFARTAGCSKSESICKCIAPASASGKGEGIVCVEQHESGVEVGKNLGGVRMVGRAAKADRCCSVSRMVGNSSQ